MAAYSACLHDIAGLHLGFRSLSVFLLDYINLQAGKFSYLC
jgi:hypothetical protein